MDEPEPADHELDVRGLGCAGVLIELARLWRSLSRSSVVVVETDDAGAPLELPSWCRMTGNTFVGVIAAGEASSRYQLILQTKESS